MRAPWTLAVLALPALLAAAGEAGWRIESSDTGPNAFVIWNDYAPWKDNRSTYLGDAGSFTLLVQVQEEGDYRWRLKDELQGAPNPAFRLYDELRVTSSRDSVDLAQPPHEAPTSTHWRSLEVRNFTVSYRIRNLTQAEYDALAQETEAYVEQENRSRRSGEIISWVTLRQDEAPANASSGGAEYSLWRELDLALAYRILFDPLRFQASDEGPASAKSLADEPVLVKGRQFWLSGPAHAHLRVEGDLGGSVVEFFLDNETVPLWTVPPNAFNPATPAVWTPGASGLLVSLPAGEHRLLYQIHPSARGIDGRIHLEQIGGQFAFADEVRGPPNDSHATWPWISTAVVVIVVGGLLPRMRRRFRARIRPWANAVARRLIQARARIGRERGPKGVDRP